MQTKGLKKGTKITAYESVPPPSRPRAHTYVWISARTLSGLGEKLGIGVKMTQCLCAGKAQAEPKEIG